MELGDFSKISWDQMKLEYLTVKDNTFNRGHVVHSISSNYIRFAYIHSGSVEFRMENGETMRAEAHDLVYFPNRYPYSSYWGSEGENHYLTIDILLTTTKGDVVNFGSKHCILLHDGSASYKGIVSQIAQTSRGENPFFALECISLVLKFCYEVACQQAETIENSRFSKIISGVFYLENNYLADFSIDSLAQMCAVSATSFRRLFYEYKGMSPVDYRNSLRVNRANDLLKTGKYTVTEVADMVNFGDVAYFSKLFKRYTGCNPKDVKNGVY